MELRQGNLLQSLTAIQQFLNDNAAKLDGISETGSRKQLDALIAGLTATAATQSGSSLAAKSATQKQRTVAEALLKDHMELIARIAASKLPPLPEIGPLALPRGRETGARLAARARGMAKEAANFESLFIDAGLPKDFIKQLTDAADLLSQWTSEKKNRQGTRGEATKRLRADLAAATRVVRVLDAFVSKAARHDAPFMAAWKIVKRLRRPGVNAKPVVEAPASQEVPSTPAGGVA